MEFSEVDELRKRLIPTLRELGVGKAWDVTYSDAIPHILEHEIKGVKIHYLKPELLIKTKMGVRPKHVQDRDYLERLTKGKK